MERTVIVTLSDDEAAFVDSQIEHGVFEDETALVREGVAQMKREQEWLKAEIQKGIDDIEAGRYVTFKKPGELKAYLLNRLEDRRS